MSGGGDGGGSPPGDGGETCGELTFIAPLNSVVPSLVAGLRVGVRLSVQIVDVGGVKVVAVLLPGTTHVVGSLTSHLPQLLRCLQAGYRYDALVESIAGGSVQVRVVPA